MKKNICLYFQVHQPTRLRQYRFFDIGKDSHYYDDFAGRTILRRIAQRCYIPMNNLLLDLIKQHGGDFKVAFSIDRIRFGAVREIRPGCAGQFPPAGSDWMRGVSGGDILPLPRLACQFR